MGNATRKECLHNTIYSREDSEPTKISSSTNALYPAEVSLNIQILSVHCLFVAWVQSMVKLPSYVRELGLFIVI